MWCSGQYAGMISVSQLETRVRRLEQQLGSRHPQVVPACPSPFPFGCPSPFPFACLSPFPFGLPFPFACLPPSPLPALPPSHGNVFMFTLEGSCIWWGPRLPSCGSLSFEACQSRRHRHAWLVPVWLCCNFLCSACPPMHKFSVESLYLSASVLHCTGYFLACQTALETFNMA